MADDIRELKVSFNGREVGRLRESSGKCLFAYSRRWLQDGFPISPRSLPLEDGVFTPRNDYFDGMFGVFSDSMPDGWGTYVALKALRRKGISYLDLDPLDRLAITGNDSPGSLSYEPSREYAAALNTANIDEICRECNRLIEGDDACNLDAVFAMAGSTGGARPKANIVLGDGEWIVKFRERTDPEDSGRMEYEYNMAARECGIDVPESRFIPSEEFGGFFASKRFDRIGEKRVHMITLGGLLEVPRDLPMLDYMTFLQATGYITQSQEEVVKAYRLACFNVLAENCDDHSKNFAYLYSEDRGSYVLAPAYDLTRTANMREHEMTCMGSDNPGEKELLELASGIHIPENRARNILDRVKDTVNSRLSKWL